MGWLISVLVGWLISATAVYIAAKIVPGVRLESYKAAFLVAAVFTLCSTLVGWLLWTIFAVGTLGLALLLGFITRVIVNAIVLKITAALTDTFAIEGFMPSILAAIVVALSTTVMEYVLSLLNLMPAA